MPTMNRLLPALALSMLMLLPCAPAQAQSAPAASASEAPFVIEHTYWLRPGRSAQFIALFKKTRLPALQAELKAGRLLSIRMSQPQLSGGKDQWNYRVTLAWKDRAAALQFASQEKPADGSSRAAMEEQLREELVVDRSDVLVIEQSL